MSWTECTKGKCYVCEFSVSSLSPSKEISAKNANKLIEMRVQWNEALILRNLEDEPRILLNSRGFL